MLKNKNKMRKGAKIKIDKAKIKILTSIGRVLAQFSIFYCMKKLYIDCPHCGVSFEAEIQGEESNMMVFCCARCKTPLMYFHGEIAELDKDEFAELRKKLSKAIDVVISSGGPMGDVANSLKKIVDASNSLANERALPQNELQSGMRKGSAPLEFSKDLPNKNEQHKFSDESMEQLKKNLDELNVDSFLDSI